MSTTDLERRVRILEQRIACLEKGMSRKSPRGVSRGVRFFDGFALVKARVAAGWSQPDIANAVGVSKNAVHNWETRKSRVPEWRAEEITDIFQKCGASPPKWQPWEPA